MISKLISELTDEEKIALICGTHGMYTNSISRLSIRSLTMSDGPHGLRKQPPEGGLLSYGTSEIATAFPPASTTANSFNVALLYAEGQAIASECHKYDVDLLLGPSMNIKRHPLNGRNFEYFSEDPYLIGEMALGFVKGLQDNGVGACIKHFAFNNSETFRTISNSIVDERAAREIYLKAFQRVIKEGEPYAVMCGYNKYNGVFCSENEELLTGILRTQWGYKGLTMTDWGATNDRVLGIKSGLDLEMPGDTPSIRGQVKNALDKKMISDLEINKAVYNVLHLIEKCDDNKSKVSSCSFDENDKLACDIATQSAVLLKNDGTLPLAKERDYACLGLIFSEPLYQGSGSSNITPYKLTSVKDAFEKRNVKYEYAEGYDFSNETNIVLLENALNIARNHETVLLFVGATDSRDTEGVDKATLNLPNNQIELIQEVLKLGKKVILVLFTGDVITLPDVKKVNSILNMQLPGQAGGEACGRLLFGEDSPSGRLAETWINSLDDIPNSKDYGNKKNDLYKESILIGYRYTSTTNTKVAYPFGYGLSYTQFEYSNIAITREDDTIHVFLRLTNTGDYDGFEVVQIYARGPKTKYFKPKKELKAFKKIFVKKGSTESVVIDISIDELKIYDVSCHGFILEKGQHTIEVCKDVETVIFSEPIDASDGVKITSIYPYIDLESFSSGHMEEISDHDYLMANSLTVETIDDMGEQLTLDSTLRDFKRTFWGRRIFALVNKFSGKPMKNAKKIEDVNERIRSIQCAKFIQQMSINSTIRFLSMNAGDMLTLNRAQGLVDIANGHIFRGLKKMIKRTKTTKLPNSKK